MSARRREIAAAVAGRPLIWFGTRGLDAAPLSALGRLALVTSQIAPLERVEVGEQDCLEKLLQTRYDLDQYDIDLDLSPRARGLKARFADAARAPAIVVAYRPADFLTGPAFCEPDLTCAFNLHILQRQFEHKHWVERSLMRAAPDVAILPTHFVRHTDAEAVRALVGQGPMVGRTSRGSGGAGVFLFSSEHEFFERLPAAPDGFVGVTPLLEKAAPLNVNACIYDDGRTVGFAASFQLVGVRGLTRRRFGFCGNDFAAAAALDDSQLDAIERVVQSVGGWLAPLGYRGVFGLDLLLDGDVLHLTEINARFQASTPLASSIAQACGAPDPSTEHVAAFLGLQAPRGVDVRTQTRLVRGHTGAVAQVIHRNTLVDAVYLDAPPALKDGIAIEGAAAHDTTVASEAMLYRGMHSRSVTTTGYEVSSDVEEMVRATRKGY